MRDPIQMIIRLVFGIITMAKWSQNPLSAQWKLAIEAGG